MKKIAIRKGDDKGMPVKKDDSKLKTKRKNSKAPLKEVTEPRLPVSDSNSGYIPFGG